MIDLNEVKGHSYNPAVHSFDDLIGATKDLFQVAFSDLANAARGSGDKVKEDYSWGIFLDYAADLLSDFGVPYKTIKKIKAVLRKRA